MNLCKQIDNLKYSSYLLIALNKKKAIKRILSAPAWSRQLATEARKRVESEFGWNNVARQLEQQYLAQLTLLQQEFLLPTA